MGGTTSHDIPTNNLPRGSTSHIAMCGLILESGDDGYNGKYQLGIKSLCERYNRQYPLDIISLCDGYKNKYPSSTIATLLTKWMASAVIAKILLACVRSCAVSKHDDREDTTCTCLFLH